MRAKILFLSIFLIIVAEVKGQTVESSQNSNVASTEQCGKSQRSPGPRHHRSGQKQSSCKNEKDQNTNQRNTSSSEKAAQK